MALVFNQARDTRQFVNPYGIKFTDSYFDTAKLSMENGRLIAKRPDRPEAYSLGKFVISSRVALSDTIRVSAVLWMDLSPAIDLSDLASLNPTSQDRIKNITALLDNRDKLFTHNDVHDIIRQINPGLFLVDAYWLSGGMMSIDRDKKILQAGLGSTYGVLTRSLLIDAFSDLAEKLGCTFQPMCPEKEIGAARSNSAASDWFDQYHIPR